MNDNYPYLKASYKTKENRGVIDIFLFIILSAAIFTFIFERYMKEAMTLEELSYTLTLICLNLVGSIVIAFLIFIRIPASKIGYLLRSGTQRTNTIYLEGYHIIRPFDEIVKLPGAIQHFESNYSEYNLSSGVSLSIKEAIDWVITDPKEFVARDFIQEKNDGESDEDYEKRRINRAKIQNEIHTYIKEANRTLLGKNFTFIQQLLKNPELHSVLIMDRLTSTVNGKARLIGNKQAVIDIPSMGISLLRISIQPINIPASMQSQMNKIQDAFSEEQTNQIIFTDFVEKVKRVANELGVDVFSAITITKQKMGIHSPNEFSNVNIENIRRVLRDFFK